MIKQMVTADKTEIKSERRDVYGSVAKWIGESDMAAYGDGFVLMRDLFFDYIYFCKAKGIVDICTDRLFSKSLQSAGFEMEYKRNGTCFRVCNK